MKTKFNKESRNLLIGMLLGDGTISSNYVYKLSHCTQQIDYLQWKIKLLNIPVSFMTISDGSNSKCFSFTH